MGGTNSFYERCEVLFAHKLGYGRRWKSAAAKALGIGRATLYRYFDEHEVPQDVLAELGKLETPQKPVRSDREMVVLYARALKEIQERIDERGWLPAPYPETVRRVLDLGAARNVANGSDRWPTNLDALARAAQEPLFRWVPDMSWDVAEQYFAARLIENGETTTECLTLAAPGGDPERELEENRGYEMLLGICRDRLDGEEIYRTWRRTTITNPVLQNWSMTLLEHPALAGVERIDEIVDCFYDKLPESMATDGYLPICTVTGTVLRRAPRGFHTESRDPEAIRRARSGDYRPERYRKGMLYLKRAFRTFWCLPGLAELDLAGRLANLGWSCTLWPKLDRVDLVGSSPDGRRRIAADVKDYFSPAKLSARFNGFKEYEDGYECFLVVPDYVPEIDESFEARFAAFRAARGKRDVDLRTVSDLVDYLEGGE